MAPGAATPASSIGRAATAASSRMSQSRASKSGMASRSASRVQSSRASGRSRTGRSTRSGRSTRQARAAPSFATNLAGVTPDVISKEERIKRFGLDCGDGLTFSRWVPGGEYNKKLVIKNVSNHSINLRYKLPGTKFFFMEFPEAVKLNPGMSYAPEVKFRPIKSEEYTDFIEVTIMSSLGEDHFYVPLHATLPVSALVVPEKFDFGTVPAQETAQGSFLIANTGDVTLSYRWSIPSTFSFTPNSGELAPGQTKTVHATFSPTTATHFQGTALCTIGTSEPVSMQLLGTCKYPFLSVDGETAVDMDFGDVLAGNTKELEFSLYNPTSVYASYDLAKVSTFHSDVFTVTPAAARVEPGASQEVTVKYAPQSATMLSIDTMQINVSGGNQLNLSFRGHCAGPIPSLSASSVDFGDVKLGTTVTRRLTLYNNAAIPAPYELSIGDGGVFHCDKPSGVIPAAFETTIVFTCSPLVACNYYRRVHVLVKHADALSFDLLATCFDDKVRPPPFDISHVRAYQERTNFDARRKVPTHPTALPTPSNSGQGRATALSFMSDTVASGTDVDVGPMDDEDVRVCASRENTREFLFPNTDESNGVFFEQESVDFGYQSLNTAGEFRDITVYNTQKFKVSAVWVMPGEATPSRAEQASKMTQSGAQPDLSDLNFVVLPRSADIPANGSYTFRVQFRPAVDNFYYGSQLECFINHKANRSFRLINYSTFVPPVCLALPTSGHTFNPKREQYLPMVEVPTKRVTFPAVLVGESTYQVFELRNKGVTPMRFHFATIGDVPADTFVCKPAKGTVPPETSQLVLFRFTPGKAKTYATKATCLLNNSSASGIKVSLVGTGFTHGIDLGSKSSVYLPPTCLGEVSTREIRLRNPLRVPVAYTWYVPERISDLVGVFPPQGVLEGNDYTPVEFSFAPKHARMYDMKVHLYVDTIGGRYQGTDPEELVNMLQHAPSPNALTQAVQVSGEGSAGSVKIIPSQLTLPPVLVGSSSTCSITLVNSSNVGMTYGIAVEYIPDTSNSDGGVDDFDDVSDAGILEVNPPTVFLHARGTEKVDITFTPSSNRNYKFKLYVSGASDVLDRLAQSGLPAEPADCLIEAAGQYPVLQFCDLRSNRYTVSRLHHMMSIDPVNVALADAPSHEEAQAIEQGVSKTDMQVEEFEFNFGTGRLNTESSEVTTLLRNVSAMPISFSIKMPNDIEVLPEHWVDTGEPSEQEIQNNMILDSQIFQVSPKTGTIAPGDVVEVTMTYSHNIAGAHTLPVMIQVDKGKRVRLHFTGETFWPTQQVVAFDRTVHEFDQVVIGTKNPPVQSMIVYNPGNNYVDFELDPAALEAVTKDNYGFDVISCENPRGRLAPGEVTTMRWQFQPIEEKQYEFKIGVTDGSGKTVRELKIIGSGFLPKNHGDVLRAERRRESRLTLCPLIKAPNSLVECSQQFLSYGHVPVHSINRQIVVLRNTNPEKTLEFEWQLPSDIAQDVVRINPARGVLDPGETLPVKIVLIPGGRVEVFDIDAECILGTQEDKALANERQQRYESALAHLQERDDGTQDSMNLPGSRGAASVADSIDPRDGRASTGLSRPDTSMTTGARLAWGDIDPSASVEKIVVNLRGKSYETDEFERTMPGCDAKSFFIPREDDPDLYHIASGQPIAREFGEHANDVVDLFTDCVATMLREVIADPGVHQVLDTLEPEPLVHFKRWATREGVGMPRREYFDDQEEGVHPMMSMLGVGQKQNTLSSAALTRHTASGLDIGQENSLIDMISPSPALLAGEASAELDVIASAAADAEQRQLDTSGQGAARSDSAPRSQEQQSSGVREQSSKARFSNDLVGGTGGSAVSSSVASLALDMAEETPRVAEGAFLALMERPQRELSEWNVLGVTPGQDNAQSRRLMREARTRRSLEQPEFEETVEYILESTLENLVHEILSGDFNLNTQPRRIAANVAIQQHEPPPASEHASDAGDAQPVVSSSRPVSQTSQMSSYVHSAQPRSRPPSGSAQRSGSAVGK